MAHLEKELELTGIANDREISIPTITIAVARTTKTNLTSLRHHAFTVKKLGHLIKDCCKRIRKELLQKRDTSQKINGFTPKTYPLVQSVKGQTIHQENVLTVPTPPVDHKKIKQHSSPDDSLTEGT